MQGRNESIAASQQAIEQVISTANFTTNPTAVSAAPVPIDINGDGTPDYSVAVATPACVRSRPTDPASLDITNPNDRGCFGTQQIGLAATSTRCAETVWDISATTTDAVTSAQTTVHQGVGIRVDATDATNTCK